MNETVLLNSGYKPIEPNKFDMCDRLYQKNISKKPTKFFQAKYFDLFKEDGSLDYQFEYEYLEERKDCWYNTKIYALDKNTPYTIEEIENMLLGIKKQDKEV